MTDLEQLLHLVDRAERGVLLPAEAGQLRAALRGLHPRPAPPQEAPGAAVSAPRGSECPVLPSEGSKAPQGAVQGLVVHDGPSTAECAADDRRWPLQKHGE